MSELEPVWCVRNGKKWCATASGNAPLSWRITVLCLCGRHARPQVQFDGPFGYGAEIRVPTCLDCQHCLEQRQQRATQKLAKALRTGKGLLF